MSLMDMRPRLNKDGSVWAHAQSTVRFISIDFVYRPAAAELAIAIVEWLLHIIFHADIVKYLRSYTSQPANRQQSQFSECCMSYCVCKYDTYVAAVCAGYLWPFCMTFRKVHGFWKMPSHNGLTVTTIVIHVLTPFVFSLFSTA